ncbi:MAG: XdhC family protein [Acidobacteriota bacterium]|nr:XdhC family protein [Acidobacteriota bacterium]
MKELQEILKRISQFTENEKAILATVVDVVGSGYRRAGARMLIGENGYSIGTVSGGCLEADVLERAKRVIQTNEPAIVTYDTTADENSLFGLGMGCRGIVRVLLEAVTKESIIFKSFDFAIENREREVIATLIAGENNVNIGGRVFYDRLNQFDFVNLPNSFENLLKLKADCFKIFDGGRKSTVETYETDNGAAEFFIERIEPPLNLLLFGAGFDALPVVRFAKELGWRTIVIDHRAAFANRDRFPEADEIIVNRAENLPEKLFKDKNSAAIVMTHNYDRDREILHQLLNSFCHYIGALGPKKRTENLIQELRDEGRKLNENALNQIHSPIGLDIGAETPEEIALAITAEIKTTLANRSGGFLRERNKPIHNS